MPAAASHASDTVQPERLRDGSLLFRFEQPNEPAHGPALNGRSAVATLTSLPSASSEAEALSSSDNLPAANGAATDGQRRSRQSRRDRDAPQRQGRAGGREPQAGRQGNTAQRSGRGGSNGSGAGQAPAGQRNGAGRGLSVPAQGRAAGRQNGSVAPTAARGHAAAEHGGREPAEPRPSFMDIPPPQQQYRSMRAVSGGNNGSGEEDDVASAGPAGRSAWKSRGRPQRVRTGLRTAVALSLGLRRRLSISGLCSSPAAYDPLQTWPAALTRSLHEWCWCDSELTSRRQI